MKKILEKIIPIVLISTTLHSFAQTEGGKATDIAKAERQVQANIALNKARIGKTYQDCSDCPTMVYLPSGDFQMGGLDFSDSEPIHQVKIKQFSMSETEVTFSQWDSCYNAGGCKHKPKDDEGWGRGDRPVMNVNWYDAQEYIKWLNKKTDGGYRLPSESEWEYAARSGSTTLYSWGNNIGNNKANCDECGSGWDVTKTAPVKSFISNAFGLYDMHGNVEEWVQDCYHSNYSGAPTNGEAWMKNCTSSSGITRGGSYLVHKDEVTSSYREAYERDMRADDTGFRLSKSKVDMDTNKINGDAFRKKKERDPSVKKTSSGLLYEVLRQGTGRKPSSSSTTVEVHYIGSFIDGTSFDSSYKLGKTATFALNQVILGLTEGVQLMREGSKYRFYIPPNLAYKSSIRPLGPNRTLVFVVELIKIK